MLRDASESRNGGILTAVMGPSGAAKFTFLQLFDGTVGPTLSRVTLHGHNFSLRSLLLLDKLGFVAQKHLAPLLECERSCTIFCKNEITFVCF